MFLESFCEEDLFITFVLRIIVINGMQNKGSFGTSNSNVWLGSVNDSNNAWYVNSNGNVNSNNNQSNSYVLAPAFV